MLSAMQHATGMTENTPDRPLGRTKLPGLVGTGPILPAWLRKLFRLSTR